MSQNETTTFLQPIKKALLFADHALIMLTGIALVVLTFMIVYDVFSRFAFNAPLPATVEMSELLMAYIVFLAMGYTLTQGMHIRVTVLFEFIPKSAKVYFDLIAAAFGICFCAWVTYYSWTFFLHSYEIREEMLAVVKLPWYVGKFAMPVGFLFFMIHFIVNFMDSAMIIFGRFRAAA
jgi:TRAP-type C4-dicarboxylate transport system permease small subunit